MTMMCMYSAILNLCVHLEAYVYVWVLNARSVTIYYLFAFLVLLHMEKGFLFDEQRWCNQKHVETIRMYASGKCFRLGYITENVEIEKRATNNNIKKNVYYIHVKST